MRRASLLVLVFALSVPAAPYVAYRGIVNAASYAPAGLPHGSIARGSVFTIFGTGLGPSVGAQVSAFPLTPLFQGVSVAVSQGNTTVAAIPLYVSATQINAILPSNAPLGRVSLRVTYNNEPGNPAFFNTSAVTVGLYSIYAGAGPGIFQNFVSQSEQPINTLTNTARPGQVLTLWGTGLGAVPSDTVAPTPGDLPANVEIFVGDKPARKLYSGRSPCCAGSDQIVFEVPSNAPLGCYVPVTVRANGISSNTVTVAVHPTGGNCEDAHNPLGSPSAAATEPRNAGYFLFNIGRAPTRLNFTAAAHFETQQGALRFHPVEALPPLNTCTVYAGKANIGVRDFLPSLPATGAPLAAAVSVLLDVLDVPKPAEASPFYFTQYSIPTKGLNYEVRPEPSNVSATAGAVVGSFRAPITKVNFPPAAGLRALSTIRRTTPLDISWTPQPNAAPFVIVAGGASHRASNSSALFFCVADARTGRFTIPAHILATLPAARNNLEGNALIAVGNVSTPTDLVAPGLLKAITLFTAFDYKPVEVQ